MLAWVNLARLPATEEAIEPGHRIKRSFLVADLLERPESLFSGTRQVVLP